MEMPPYRQQYMVSIGDDIIKFLVSIGDDIIKFLVSIGDDIIKFLVSIGDDIHADNDGIVIWAARNGHLEVVKYLVSQGANKINYSF